VKHWPKFEKLLVVLEASMQTIVDMWGDGKTSFARLFTVSEVRGLIKALFKNTDRRAEALARIKLPTM
jgi:centromere/kinetochore protein ZW10